MKKKTEICALLPLKAHSARVQGKNFKSFANKPLFRWILDTLLSIDDISKIVINTDARDLLKKNGFEESGKVVIRDRPKELCGDMVSMNRVIKNDVENVPSECYLMTHTTNPLLTATTIKKALATYFDGIESNSGDSLFSVNKYQTRFYKKDGSPINHDPENLIRTQDLEPYYEENSNLYIFNDESFNATGARIGNRPILFETPTLESFDIDDQEGWNLAEIIALYRQMANVGI
ncbi:MAG: acylneuraminate cytidylyltransferase family protein [Verrucomicrobiota bacterium]